MRYIITHFHYFYHFIYIILRFNSRFTLFPCTTLFRSYLMEGQWIYFKESFINRLNRILKEKVEIIEKQTTVEIPLKDWGHRSEEHTSELQSREKLVCRLLLEKKNIF